MLFAKLMLVQSDYCETLLVCRIVNIDQSLLQLQMRKGEFACTDTLANLV